MPRRTILIVGVVGVVIIAAVAGLRRTTPSSTAPAPPPTAHEPVPVPKTPESDQPFLDIEGTQLAGSDPKGRRLWDIKATTLQVDRTKNIVIMTDVSGQLFEKEKTALTFTAPRARFFAASKDVELTGGVSGRTPDGRTLRAAVVRWDGRKGIFVASGGVTVSQAGMIIRADRLTSDAAMRRPTFSGHISVQVTQ